MGSYVITPVKEKVRRECGAERVRDLDDAHDAIRDVAALSGIVDVVSVWIGGTHGIAYCSDGQCGGHEVARVRWVSNWVMR